MNNSIYEEIISEFSYMGDIENLDGLSVRTFNALKRARIDTISELKEMTDEELRQIRNLGKKGREEIAAVITNAVPDRRRTMWLELDIDDIEPLASGMAKAGERNKSAYIRRLIQTAIIEQ